MWTSKRSVKDQSKITVGIMYWQTEVFGHLDGNFRENGFGPVSGRFSATILQVCPHLPHLMRREVITYYL